MKTLIIDNYDSYTYNLFQLVWSVTDTEPTVIKNDECTIDEIQKMNFDNVILSPGPGNPMNPKDFGVCIDVLQQIKKPILGVCLGHQGLAYLYGAKIIPAPVCMHGLTSPIYHTHTGLFENIPSPFRAMRYHSLIVDCVPDELECIARTEDGLIMGLQHKTKPIYGVQFHPESVATEYGKTIIENFCHITEKSNRCVSFHKKKCTVSDVAIFDTLVQKDPHLVWLDSSKIVENDSRYSIFGLASKRSHILSYNSEKKEITLTGAINKTIHDSLFHYLNDFLSRHQNHTDLIFSLGYIGYLGYEMKGECTGSYCHKSSTPDSILKFVDRAVIHDHETEELIFVYFSDDYFDIDHFTEIKSVKPYEKMPSYHLERSREEYLSDISHCIEEIKQGESYEICLTNRLIIDQKIDAPSYYKYLRSVSPGQYSALLLFDPVQVCCSSMERFLRVRDRIVETKPIKGTLPRGKTQAEDEKMKRRLKEEEHYHSENLMIVDLLRNDLGRVCKKNSVQVTKLLDVETYTTLHQLVSTVQGQFEEGRTVVDCIRQTFPGGSMTGAPKVRTMEIIDRLEQSPRGIYSGTIGYLSLNGNADFNIVIRTSVIEKDKTTIGVGGAIIYLSNAEDEYDEILLKASASLQALKNYYEGKK